MAVLNATFTKGESTSPNVKNFAIKFDMDAVNDDAQYAVSLVLQSSRDVTIVSSIDESITNGASVSLFTSSLSKSSVKCLLFDDIDLLVVNAAFKTAIVSSVH